ncbi:MAG: TonB-dependent receptor [Bacteroidota bacterium]
MFKLCIISILIFIFNTTNIIAENVVLTKASLVGKITNKNTGETIPGVTIYVPDLKTGCVSDINGNYIIENLPRTKLLLQVSCISYRTIIITVDLNKDTLKNFVMEQSVVEMNTVVVTGTSKATEIIKNPIPMATLGYQELHQNLSTNIIDAVTNIPGVSAVSTGANVSKPFIHGLGYNRVLTLYDGIRQEGQQWGDEHGIEIDEYAVDRVEVVKGPASLIYGSGALGGVVNLLPDQTLMPGNSKSSLLTEYQTNNKLIGNSFNYDANNATIIYDIRLSHKQATNYQNKIDNRVYGTAFNETDLKANIGINKHWGYSHLTFSIYDNLQEIPDGSRDSLSRKFTKQITEADTLRPIVSNEELSSYSISPLHQHIQHYRIYSSNNLIIGDGKLAFSLGWQQNIRREYSHPQATDVAGLYLNLNTFTYDIKYYLPEKKEWDITVGLNGMLQQNTNKGTEFIIPDYHQFDNGAFLSVKKTIKKIDIIAGIRYDISYFSNDEMYTQLDPISGFYMQVSPTNAVGNTKVFNNFSHTFTGTSASIGATYTLSNNMFLKVNIAKGYRAPSVSEITANGVHPGTNIYQLGNTDFKPELSFQQDIGLFFNTNHVKISLELFNNTINNYIFNQKVLNVNNQDSIIINGNKTFKYRQSQAQLYGGEFNIDIHPHPLDWLHFENSISVVYALNKGGNGIIINDSNKYLPFISPLHTHTDLRVNLNKTIKHLTSTYFKIAMDYYAAQDRVYLADNTETYTPSYILFNIGLGADVINKKGKTLFNFNISVNNLFDVAYQSHQSRLKYFEPYPNNTSGHSGIYNMGRNIGLKIIVPIK